MSTTRANDRPIYDAFDDPGRRRAYRRAVARTTFLAILGVTILGVLGGVVFQQGSLAPRVVYLVFLGPLLLVSLSPLILVRGERDSLRIYTGKLELPTRSLLDAFLGKPNLVMELKSLATVYLPTPNSSVPFVGFEDEAGDITLVHRDHAGNLEHVTDLLRRLGVRVVEDPPPPDRVIWRTTPRWVRRGPGE